MTEPDITKQHTTTNIKAADRIYLTRVHSAMLFYRFLMMSLSAIGIGFLPIIATILYIAAALALLFVAYLILEGIT